MESTGFFFFLFVTVIYCGGSHNKHAVRFYERRGLNCNGYVVFSKMWDTDGGYREKKEEEHDKEEDHSHSSSTYGDYYSG